MNLVLVGFVFFLVAIAIMSIGVFFGRKPIKGTCGGLNQFTESSCEICGGNKNACSSTMIAEKKQSNP